MNERGEIAIGLMLVLTITLCGWLGNYKDVKYEEKVQELMARCAVVETIE